MKVLSVASEVAPLVKTGGLADVAGALPAALAAHGVAMRVMMPAYRGLAAGLEGARRLAVPMVAGPDAAVITGRAAGMDLLLVDDPALYDRDGGPYIGPDGRDWPDNDLRFARLAQVAAAVAVNGIDGWRPDAVHGHDWQTGLLPVYLRLASGGQGEASGKAAPPCLMTIHNIAFQGRFPAARMAALGLPASLYTPDGVEFHGDVGFLKAGLNFADRISTVSLTYARELMEPQFGMGLEGLIRHRASALTGILNGIDTDVWDPANDPALPVPYSALKPGGKQRARTALARRFGLKPGKGPIFIVISRMTRQKGLDLLLEALPYLLWRGGRLAVLGSGERDLEAGFLAAAREHPGQAGTVIGYDEPLSHLMQGGGDAILIPSRFEPCGLTQLYGLRYGTIPVVARTGGLADTVIDANDAALRAGAATGIQHAPDSLDALMEAIGRTCDLFAHTEVWRGMRRRAMRHPVGWETAAGTYAALYRGMTGGTAA